MADTESTTQDTENTTPPQVGIPEPQESTPEPQREIDPVEQMLVDKIAEIDEQLQEFNALNAEKQRLQAALAAMRGETIRKVSTPRKRSASTGGNRASKGERVGQVLDFIKAHPEGTSNKEISEGLGGLNPAQVSQLVKQLVESEQAYREGRTVFPS